MNLTSCKDQPFNQKINEFRFFDIHEKSTKNCDICEHIKTILPSSLSRKVMFHSSIHKKMEKVAKKALTLICEEFNNKNETIHLKAKDIRKDQFAIIVKALTEKLQIVSKNINFSRYFSIQKKHQNLIHPIFPPPIGHASVSLFWSLDHPILEFLNNNRMSFCSYHNKNKLLKLWEKAQKGIECDVTIALNEHSLTAHQLILSANSKYFRTLFNSRMKESQDHVIKVNTTPKAMKAVLEYLYTGEIENFEKIDFYSIQDLFDVLELSELYGKKHLSELCLVFIHQNCGEETQMELVRNLKNYHNEIVLKLICEWAETSDKIRETSFLPGVFNISRELLEALIEIAQTNHLSKINNFLDKYKKMAFPECLSEKK